MVDTNVTSELLSAQNTFFSFNPQNDKLFSVLGGVPIEDALNQASCFLASALTVAYSDQKSEMAYSAGYLIEMAKALVDSAIEGLLLKEVRHD